jgi:hypothetical protein
MRSGRTHDILTGYTMPRTKKKLIRKINQEIDNPSPFYKQFKKHLGLNSPKFEIPGLTYYNHRKKAGHDMTDGIYYMAKYGQEGFNAWLNHQAQDMISDFMVKNYGSFARNIFEDSILEFSRPKYRKSRYF